MVLEGIDVEKRHNPSTSLSNPYNTTHPDDGDTTSTSSAYPPYPSAAKGKKRSHGAPEVFARPPGWRGAYAHPATQVAMLGVVCFMCPGMFNALTGLGGGGQVDTTVSANSTAALYATYAFFGFFSGSINNKLGAKLTLLLGSWGYALYISSYLVVNIHPGAGDYVIVAGAILGVCASLLWTAQGAMMMAYPTEAQKGLYIGIFWTIFNVGGVVGAAVAFGQNFRASESESVITDGVGNGTYIGFLVLSTIGVAIPLFMKSPKHMIRTDGTRVQTVRHPSWRAEFWSLFVALKTDPMILFLFPMFFASNYFYTWQFNDYNAAIFDIRARGLNNLVYWTSQIFGSMFIGYCVLDLSSLRRRTRAFLGWALVFGMVFVVHVWAFFYQRTYTRAGEAQVGVHKIDIYDAGYAAHVWLMIFYGLLDSMWQTYAYWLMGAMSNDPAKLAVFAGFYKSLQSAGAAGVWRADGVGLPYMSIFLSTWCLSAGGMVCALPMVYLRVRDRTEIEDETLMQVPGAEKVEGRPAVMGGH